jgi:hypothetical protein
LITTRESTFGEIAREPTIWAGADGAGLMTARYAARLAPPGSPLELTCRTADRPISA